MRTGHVKRVNIVREQSGPTDRELFLAQNRLLKRVLRYLVLLEGSRKELTEDVRSLLGMAKERVEVVEEMRIHVQLEEDEIDARQLH